MSKYLNEGGGAMQKLLVALIAAALIASAAPTHATTSPQITIEFWTIELEPFYTDFMRNLIARFEKTHPGIKVKWVNYSCGGVGCETYEQQVRQAVTPPDVANLNTLIALRLVSEGKLAPVPDTIANTLGKRFFTQHWESTRYQGKVWAIPWYASTSVLMFNPDIFRKADPKLLEAPTYKLPSGEVVGVPPQTTNDYLKLCKFIKDKTGIYGCMPIVDGTNLYFRFQEEGLSVLDQTKKRALFNGPPHVKLLATYVDLLANDYFPRDVLVRSYYGALELYAAEELAMLVTGPQFLLSRIKYDNLAVYKKTRVARYPLGNRKIIHSPLMNIAVSAKSKRPETAFEFALFVTNEENQVAFAKETVIFPSTILSSPVSRQFFLKGGSNPEDAARLIGFQSLPASRDLTPTFPIRKGIELAREFRNAIESAFYETKTPKEALDYAVQEWNRILAKP